MPENAHFGHLRPMSGRMTNFADIGQMWECTDRPRQRSLDMMKATPQAFRDVPHSLHRRSVFVLIRAQLNCAFASALCHVGARSVEDAGGGSGGGESSFFDPTLKSNQRFERATGRWLGARRVRAAARSRGVRGGRNSSSVTSGVRGPPELRTLDSWRVALRGEGICVEILGGGGRHEGAVFPLCASGGES